MSVYCRIYNCRFLYPCEYCDSDCHLEADHLEPDHRGFFNSLQAELCSYYDLELEPRSWLPAPGDSDDQGDHIPF